MKPWPFFLSCSSAFELILSLVIFLQPHPWLPPALSHEQVSGVILLHVTGHLVQVLAAVYCTSCSAGQFSIIQSDAASFSCCEKRCYLLFVHLFNWDGRHVAIYMLCLHWFDACTSLLRQVTQCKGLMNAACRYSCLPFY